MPLTLDGRALIAETGSQVIIRVEGSSVRACTHLPALISETEESSGWFMRRLKNVRSWPWAAIVRFMTCSKMTQTIHHASFLSKTTSKQGHLKCGESRYQLFKREPKNEVESQILIRQTNPFYRLRMNRNRALHRFHVVDFKWPCCLKISWRCKKERIIFVQSPTGLCTIIILSLFSFFKFVLLFG